MMQQNAPAQANMNDEIFLNAPKIMVKQEFAAIEMCSCEAKNRYRVSVPNGEEEGTNIFMYIDEDSGCFERICCSVSRTLTLNAHQGATKDGPILMAMHKPFHCQGCCFMRPKFEVYAGPEKNNQQVGTIEDPCRCCMMDQQINDSSGTTLYTTYGSMCQLGLCCPCCASVDFQVKKNGADVGLISKRPMTFCEMIKKTNRFTIDFPKDASPAQRKLVFAAAMLADLEYFEQNKNSES